MTSEEMERRADELRAEDPHGRLSANDIKRIVLREHIHDKIHALPDNTEAEIDLKGILRTIMEVIR